MSKAQSFKTTNEFLWKYKIIPKSYQVRDLSNIPTAEMSAAMHENTPQLVQVISDMYTIMSFYNQLNT